MKYDLDISKMIIEDFCQRQQQLITNAVFDEFINNCSADTNTLAKTYGKPFEPNRDTEEYIKHIANLGFYKEYIRIPELMKNYLYVRENVKWMIYEEKVSTGLDIHNKLMESIQPVRRGKRRETIIQEQRKDRE